MNTMRGLVATAGVSTLLVAGGAQAEPHWGDEWWICTKPVASVGMRFDCHRKGDETIQIEADLASMGAKGLRAYSTTTEQEHLVVLFGRLASAR